MNLNNLSEFKQEVHKFVKSGTPILYIKTSEERRILELIREIILEYNVKQKPQGQIFEWLWSYAKGLILYTEPRTKHNQDIGTSESKCERDPSNKFAFSATHALDRVLNYYADAAAENNAGDHDWHQNNIFFFLDLHDFLKDSKLSSVPTEKITSRLLRDIDYLFRKRREINPGSINKIIIISPIERIPEGLDNSLEVMVAPLPSYEELDNELHNWEVRNQKEFHFQEEGEDVNRKSFINAARGLIRDKFTDFLDYQFLTREDTKKIIKITQKDLENLLFEKKRLVEEASGHAIEFSYSPGKMDSAVGGFSNLKEWLKRRKYAFIENNQPGDKGYGLPKPKGLLLVGIPGGGKSLAAKTIAYEWQIPCLRFDLASLREGIVGASEQKLKNALWICESVAPAVLWIDEVEKAFIGRDTGGDSGVSMRIYSSLLTWMQDRTAPVFIVATANDLKLLDAAFKRPGRFDNIMSVGLPGEEASVEIIKIHYEKIWINYFRKKGPEIVNLEEDQIKRLAEIVVKEKLTGAAVEKRMKDALYMYALDDNIKKTTDDKNEKIYDLIKSVIEQGYPRDNFGISPDLEREWSFYEPVDDNQKVDFEKPVSKLKPTKISI